MKSLVLATALLITSFNLLAQTSQEEVATPPVEMKVSPEVVAPAPVTPKPWPVPHDAKTWMMKKGQRGLSFGFPSAGGNTVYYSQFISNLDSLRVGFSYSTAKHTGSKAVTTGGLDLGWRTYKKKSGHLLFFVQPGFTFNATQGNSGLYGLYYHAGGEYILLPNFTTSIEAGLSYAMGGTSSQLLTGTSALMVNLYF